MIYFEDELHFLKEKVDVGADYVITQLFYDVNLFIDWYNSCRRYGIQCPILPGIMPIQSYSSFQRMTTLCKTRVPEHIQLTLESIKDDDEAVKAYGIELAIQMCRAIQSRTDILGFHLYTMNLEKSVRLILEGLGWIAPLDRRRPLPWKMSITPQRELEDVRPIFWKNRSKSYVLRTETWDDFPNGRWGDSRSPAFGIYSLDGSRPFDFSMSFFKEAQRRYWGEPTNFFDLQQVFLQYVQGIIPCLPWCDVPRQLETALIETHLCHLIKKGLLTVNSQPAVNGFSSSDTCHGWGPKGGYVYQKAYLEFFVASDQWETLKKRIDWWNQQYAIKESSAPRLTYYAVKGNSPKLQIPSLEPTQLANALKTLTIPHEGKPPYDTNYSNYSNKEEEEENKLAVVSGRKEQSPLEDQRSGKSSSGKSSSGHSPSIGTPSYRSGLRSDGLETNVRNERPNALTWGVFPGREIVQPTVVDAISFIAWKDEAFQLWCQWSEMYSVDSTARKVCQEIAENWYLVNVVDNDYIHGCLWDVMDYESDILSSTN